MKNKETSDEEFLKKLEIYEKESVDDFIDRNCFNEEELVDIISHLISHREQMRDFELEKLKVEAENVLEKFQDTKKKQLLEEIKCFKEIIALQKQLLKLRKDES